ncbi:transcription termination/antitermination NusG family protein [Peptostreptococcus stomatis]|uniref:transcription termination/antitermination NusG family protein n=1 Tax=Peptostreptococcus stomatis TaxID=341694 RepID=UPI00399530FB
MEQFIQEVVVPTEDVVKLQKQEKKKLDKEKYIQVTFNKMIITDESWYIVRNTRCYRFVGPGSKPVPLSEAEVEAMGIDLDKVSAQKTEKEVEILRWSFVGQTGTVKSIDKHKKQSMADAFGGEIA